MLHPNRHYENLEIAEMSKKIMCNTSKRKLMEIEEIPDLKRLKISSIDDKNIENKSCAKCNGLLWIPQSKGSNNLIHLCDDFDESLVNKY